MLKVHLFGSGAATHDGLSLSGFPTRQAGLLFCYLVLNRSHPQPRERLAAVFWEDLPSATARTYLRNTLWRLKGSLAAIGLLPDKVLTVGEDLVGLADPAAMWIDIVQFENAVLNSQKSTPATLSSQQHQELEGAVRLYRGDLLDGIYEDWTLYERERFRLLYTNIRQKLMLHYTHLGRYEEALAHGSGLLAVDPAREKIHRQMMRLYALTGDRNAALAQFKRCKQLLRDELDLPPMRETRRLYRQIKENRFEGQATTEMIERESADPAILQRLKSLQKLAGRIKAEVQSLEKQLNRKLMDVDS
ncbi:MAG TPA: BTAD domain-containing putative transcriptional regulator [Anaerolineales bacterium]|nr:BTAD domain-containing putative transcriptional regulator [Anaerolineales bacterium]